MPHRRSNHARSQNPRGTIAMLGLSLCVADEIDRLLAQLENDPENPTVLAVLGDLLQRQGDPRGELIAMQLGIKQTDVETAVVISRRREELLQQLTPVMPDALDPFWAREWFRWGVGYVQKLEIGMHRGARDYLEESAGRARIGAALGELWAHPSMRILSELAAMFSCGVSALSTNPPRTVRTLAVGVGSDEDNARLPELLAGLPRLQRMRIFGELRLEYVHSSTLASLTLDSYSAHYGLMPLDPAKLPALRRLQVAGTGELFTVDSSCRQLARSGWLEQLTHLAIVGGFPTPTAARALADALGNRKLARLDVSGAPIPRSVYDRFAALCDELVAVLEPDAPASWVEHANKPEWGRGAIVRRHDDKIEIEFPNAGRKVFKADAPFLRFG